LKVAEESGFEMLLTTDKNIRYQQNLTGRNIAIVVLANPRWPVVRRYVQACCGRSECSHSRNLHRGRDT